MNLLEFIKNHWGKILIIFIIFIVLLAVFKFVSQILNCTGPICQGMGDILGVAAKALNTLVSGCSKQADCSKPKDKDSCNQSSGCNWSQTSGSGTCVCTTGLKAGDGGFFTPSCALGMGIISLLALLVLAPLAKMFLNKMTKSENAKAESELSGKPIDEVLSDRATESREKASEAVDKLGENGTEVSESQARATAAFTTSNVTANGATSAAEGKLETTPEQRAQNIKNSVEIAAQESKEIEDRASSEGISEADTTDAQDAADEVSMPPVETTIARIQAYKTLNQKPSVHASKLLLRHVNKHIKQGIAVSSEHIDFLKL